MSGLGQSAPPTDAPVVDTAEQVSKFTINTKEPLIDKLFYSIFRCTFPLWHC